MKKNSLQQGVALIEASFFMIILLATGFYFFETARTIELHNAAKSAASMLTDVMAGNNRADHTQATYAQDVLHLQILAEKLIDLPMEIHVSIVSQNSSGALQELSLGDDITQCTRTSSPKAIYTNLGASIPKDYVLHVVEVCLLEDLSTPLSNFAGGSIPFVDNVLPAYGISYTRER